MQKYSIYNSGEYYRSFNSNNEAVKWVVKTFARGSHPHQHQHKWHVMNNQTGDEFSIIRFLIRGVIKK